MNIIQEKNCKTLHMMFCTLASSPGSPILQQHVVLKSREWELGNEANVTDKGSCGYKLILLSSTCSGSYNAQMTAKRWMKHNLHGNKSKRTLRLTKYWLQNYMYNIIL